MKLALEKKDSDLVAMQKAAQDKTALADQKLASIGTLEGEVNKLKSCLNEANREVTSLKKDKVVLNEKLESAICKRQKTCQSTRSRVHLDPSRLHAVDCGLGDYTQRVHLACPR